MYIYIYFMYLFILSIYLFSYLFIKYITCAKNIHLHIISMYYGHIKSSQSANGRSSQADTSPELGGCDIFGWIDLCIYIYICIYIWLVVLNILKNISQWEGLSHVLWKNKMFQTTNQYIYIYMYIMWPKPATHPPPPTSWSWFCMYAVCRVSM